MTATVSALMTGASAAGLFKTAGTSSFATATYGAETTAVLSRWTTSAFCLTVFLFLTSSVTSAFFVTFALNTDASVHAIKRALGGAFWCAPHCCCARIVLCAAPYLLRTRALITRPCRAFRLSDNPCLSLPRLLCAPSHRM